MITKRDVKAGWVILLRTRTTCVKDTLRWCFRPLILQFGASPDRRWPLRTRFCWALGGAVLLGFVLVLARTTTAGPLDPPGPVGPTMRTLDELIPSWGKTLSATDGCASARFTCVLSDQAVLDHETGLVWDRAPDATLRTWDAAYKFCAQRVLGTRQGWRLPTLPELQSLLDGTALPAGNPITLPSIPTFWSASPSGVAPDEIFAVFFSNGSTDTRSANVALKSWCVRGALVTDGGTVERGDGFGSWSRLLSSSNNQFDACNSQRFRCVMGGVAVLDQETGLVWLRQPYSFTTTWDQRFNCLSETAGGRGGWRIPSVEELGSLHDGFSVAAGHPFGTLGETYWSNTELDGTFAWVFDFVNDGDGVRAKTEPRTNVHSTWCVRGPGLRN